MRSAQFALVVSLLVLATLPQPTAAAEGVALCDGLTRCAGAAAYVSGGCAVTVGSLAGVTAGFEVCANSAVAAAGALALVLPFGVVETTATAEGTDTKVDDCVLYRTLVPDVPPSALIPATSVTCASAAGELGGCVAAEAQAMAKNVLGPIATPIVNAEVTGCAEFILKTMKLAEASVQESAAAGDLELGETYRSKLSELPSSVQEEVRAMLGKDLETSVSLQLQALGGSDMAEALRNSLITHMKAELARTDGDVWVTVTELPGPES